MCQESPFCCSGNTIIVSPPQPLQSLPVWSGRDTILAAPHTRRFRWLTRNTLISSSKTSVPGMRGDVSIGTFVLTSPRPTSLGPTSPGPTSSGPTSLGPTSPCPTSLGLTSPCPTSLGLISLRLGSVTPFLHG